MSYREHGFTIVEAIIIISVLGILVAIGIVGWGGIQTWSQNKTRENEVNQWTSSFDLFKSKYGYYPSMPTSGSGTNLAYYCLGVFPTTTSARCGEYTSAVGSKWRPSQPPGTEGTAAETIRTELGKIGNVPTNSAQPVNSVAVGPYVVFDRSVSGTDVTITAKFVGLFKDLPNCPDGMSDATGAPMGSGISGVKACQTQRSFTYTP